MNRIGPRSLLFAFLFMLISPTSVAATISGIVIDATDEGNKEPIENIEVQFLDAQNAQLVATSTTGRDGFYNSGYIPDGDYRVRFSGPGFRAKYAIETKDNFCIAAEFTVLPDSNIVIDEGMFPSIPTPIVLQKIGFEGTLIDALTGEPLAGIYVELRHPINGLEIVVKDSTVTDERGLFDFETNTKSDAKVRFFDPNGRYFPEYSGTIPRADDFCLGEVYLRGVTHNIGTRLTPIPPDEIPQVILDTIEDLILPNNVSTALSAPIIRIIDFLTDTNPNNDAAICAHVRNFVSRIDIQERQGKLSEEDAETLRQLVTGLKTDLGC